MEWIENLLEISEKSWYKTHEDLQEILNNNLKDVKNGIEIGVAFGGNSYKLLNNNDNLKLYSIDPYIGYSENDVMSKNVEGEKGDQVYNFVLNRLQSKFGDRSILIRDNSDYLINNFEDDSLDFIFIDGDHTYEGVKKDIENSFRKVKKGGIIAGDDYELIPSVNQAVDEFFEKNNLKINIQNLVWWTVKM
jgi:predicted O-methyltransferase YrrM